MLTKVIHPDGTVEDWEFDFNDHFQELQAKVGGTVEMVYLAPGVCGYVNEDGIALDLPRNDVATAVCRNLGPNIMPADFIKGVMVLGGRPGHKLAVRGTAALEKALEENK